MFANKLSDEDVINFLREKLAVIVSPDDVKNPTKKLVIALYSKFLSKFGYEDITQPDMNAISGLENIERHESFIKMCNVFKCTSYLVSSAGIVDMSMSDILVPTRKRTHRILSALCFLWIMLSDIEYYWCELEQNCIDLPEKRAIIQNNIRGIKRMLEEKSVFLSANKYNTLAINQKLNKLVRSYDRKANTAQALREEANTLKSLILDKRGKICEIDVEISKTREEIQVLDHKIVKYPQRVMAKTRKRENELEVCREEKKRLEKQHLEFVRLRNQLRESSKLVNHSLDSLNEAFKDLEKLRVQCELLHETKVDISYKEKKIKRFKVQLRAHEKSIKTLRKKFANHEKQYLNQIETIQQMNDDMKNELQMKRKNQSDEEKYWFEDKFKLKIRLDSMESEHQKFKEKSQMYYKQHLAAIESIKTLFDTYMKEYKF